MVEEEGDSIREALGSGVVEWGPAVRGGGVDEGWFCGEEVLCEEGVVADNGPVESGEVSFAVMGEDEELGEIEGVVAAAGESYGEKGVRGEVGGY